VKTFNTSRKRASGELEEVTADEGNVACVEFDSGAIGVLESSCVCAGRNNQFTWEVNGTDGSIAFDLEDPNHLHVCDAKNPTGELLGFVNVSVTSACHPLQAAYLPPGHNAGWEYGHLWGALVNGVLGRDGKRRAPIVLLSDADRADSSQAEWFRILTDSISGRILDPHGQMVPLFIDEWGNKPQFVCTANSCGTGDARGRMTSSNPMDGSILDRLGRKVEAAYLHWDDESAILRGKYPVIAEKAPDVIDQLGKATASLRSAIEKEEIYAELTHRGLCEILSECEDILHFSNAVPGNLLKRGFRAWLDGLDADTFLAAKRLVDPHVKGGAMGGAHDDDDY